MSDLISKEAVIETLKQTGIIQDNDLGHLIVEEINRIPTAYDIDGVVEKLKECSVNYCKEYGYAKDENVLYLPDAIGIVKDGVANQMRSKEGAEE